MCKCWHLLSKHFCVATSHTWLLLLLFHPALEPRTLSEEDRSRLECQPSASLSCSLPPSFLLTWHKITNVSSFRFIVQMVDTHSLGLKSRAKQTALFSGNTRRTPTSLAFPASRGCTWSLVLALLFEAGYVGFSESPFATLPFSEQILWCRSPSSVGQCRHCWLWEAANSTQSDAWAAQAG